MSMAQSDKVISYGLPEVAFVGICFAERYRSAKTVTDANPAPQEEGQTLALYYSG
jgi:hypothetical protein